MEEEEEERLHNASPTTDMLLDKNVMEVKDSRAKIKYKMLKRTLVSKIKP